MKLAVPEPTPNELNTGSLPVVVRLGMDYDGHRELDWLSEKIARHTAELVALYSVPESAVHGKLSSLLRNRKAQDRSPPRSGVLRDEISIVLGLLACFLAIVCS